MKKLVLIALALSVLIVSATAQTKAAASKAAPKAAASPIGRTLKGSAGTLTIASVQVSASFPPGCKDTNGQCRPAQEGFKVLTVWLKGGPKAADALMKFPKVFVESDGVETTMFSGGMMEQRLFIAFTPPKDAKNFVLHFEDNPPIPLGK